MDKANLILSTCLTGFVSWCSCFVAFMKYFIKIQSRLHIILLTKSLYECHAYPNSCKYLQISLSKYLSQWFLSSHFPHGHPRGNENTIHLGPEILACAHFLGLPLPSYMSLPQSPCLCKPVFSPTKGEELYPLHRIFVSFKWDNTCLVPDTH